jgi:hypothetical protein
VRLALAEVLAAAGRPAEAADTTAEALQLFEEKGNSAAVARVRTERRAAALP